MNESSNCSQLKFLSSFSVIPSLAVISTTVTTGRKLMASNLSHLPHPVTAKQL